MSRFKFFIVLIFTQASACVLLAKNHPVIEASLIDFQPTAWAEGTKVHGSYIDLLDAIERKTNMKIAKRVFPLLRVADRVQKGTSDLTIAPITSAFQSIKGRRIFLYKHRYILISRKDDPVCSDSDASGEIGRMRGGCSDLFSSAKIRFFELSNYNQGLTMLQKGRLKGFCGVEEGLAYSLRDMANDSPSLSKLQLAERDVFIIFSPNFSQAEFEIINKAVQELLKENILFSIRNKYMSSSEVLNKLSCERKSEIR